MAYVGKTNENIEEFFGDLKETEGYKCPNCGHFEWHGENEFKSIIESTPAIFHETPDPHYAWFEKHKCLKCETIYIISNGS